MVLGSQGTPCSSSALTTFALRVLPDFQCRGIILSYFLGGGARSAGGKGHFWLISDPFPCWGRHGKQTAVAQLCMEVQERDVKGKHSVEAM